MYDNFKQISKEITELNRKLKLIEALKLTDLDFSKPTEDNTLLEIKAYMTENNFSFEVGDKKTDLITKIEKEEFRD